MALKMCEGLGVLTREVAVRVLNISASGCLIESNRRMEIGTIGYMRLQFALEEYGDDVEVVRCRAITGAGSVYHVGMKLLWTTPRHPRSIRHAVAHHVGGIGRPGSSRVM